MVYEMTCTDVMNALLYCCTDDQGPKEKSLRRRRITRDAEEDEGLVPNHRYDSLCCVQIYSHVEINMSLPN